MGSEPLFAERDLRLIESLDYDPALEPAYDFMRSCLVWTDERADNLTPAGYETLCDLWIARSFVHRGLDFSTHPLDPHYFKDVWERAFKQGVKWPGFNRLSLKPEDREYYEKMLQEEEDGTEI